MNISARRNPYVQLILYPAQVQGEGAALSIVKGIRALEEKQVDVMIVGRGGGSIEDLWAFNEEIVARAIFECSVPVISAVGHETDTTIADFVADMRAPTPSAAAELAVYSVRDTLDYMRERERLLGQRMSWKIQESRARTERYQMRLKMSHPRQKLNENRQYLIDLENRMRSCMENRLTGQRHRLALYIEKMKGLSPLLKLGQGYSYVQTADGENIRSVSQAEPGELLDIYVSDGCIRAEVRSAQKEEYGGRTEK